MTKSKKYIGLKEWIKKIVQEEGGGSGGGGAMHIHANITIGSGGVITINDPIETTFDEIIEAVNSGVDVSVFCTASNGVTRIAKLIKYDGYSAIFNHIETASISDSITIRVYTFYCIKDSGWEAASYEKNIA